MKARTLIIIALCAALPAMACAQKKKKGKAPEPVVEEEVAIVTEDCIMYTSLFHESAKNKQYAEALEPWLAVYSTCPSYSKNVYADGVKIVQWKISQYQPGTPEYNEWRDKLMQLYDKRIKYFGDDARYPKAWILGQKALDYCTYFPEDELAISAYPWLKESVSGQGAQAPVKVVAKLSEVSLGLYKSDPDKYADQFVSDYQLCSDAYSAMISDPTNKNAEAIKNYKDNLDQALANSGAADCNKLDELYAGSVAGNLDNLEALNKIMRLYRKVGCGESSTYFAAAEAAHRLSPTAESAAGCANMCIKKEEYKDAIAYFDQATELADNDDDKADYMYRAARVLYDNLKSYAQARQYLRKSLEYKPDQGRCYLVWGLCYVSSTPYSKEEYGAKAAILNKTVYWVGVDKFVKAKQVDPSVADDANKLISMYSKYFPSKEERFDLPAEFSGSTFTVGGWIGETTNIR